MGTSRREMNQMMAGSLLAGAIAIGPNGADASAAEPDSASIFDLLGGLETVMKELENTWHPDDPAYRAEFQRQVMMNLCYGYFVHFTADAEHPDWSPLYNPVFACQPNPDDIYLFSPLRDDLTYRVSGSRGTTNKLIFVTQKGVPGTFGSMADFDPASVSTIDERDFTVGEDGQLEIIFSARRPEGYEGNWSELKPGASCMLVRYRMIDWDSEVDPQLSIECLDEVPLKPRLTPQQITDRLRKLAMLPTYQDRLFYPMQNDVRDKVGVNVVDPMFFPGLSKQVYWPAVFQFADDEALIVETPLPKVRPYWNIQLNDPLYNAVEYVYRISSINESTAWIGADGMFRAVIAKDDPGVANWLDPFGYNEGTLYGRWYECDTTPTPVIKRVPLGDLRSHLPADTPEVSPLERDEQLRTRIRAAQRRRRW